MNYVWVAVATTKGGDVYTFAFRSEPTNDRVIMKLIELESADECSMEWYARTTHIHVERVDVE